MKKDNSSDEKKYTNYCPDNIPKYERTGIIFTRNSPNTCDFAPEQLKYDNTNCNNT